MRQSQAAYLRRQITALARGKGVGDLSVMSVEELREPLGRLVREKSGGSLAGSLDEDDVLEDMGQFVSVS